MVQKQIKKSLWVSSLILASLAGVLAPAESWAAANVPGGAQTQPPAPGGSGGTGGGGPVGQSGQGSYGTFQGNNTWQAATVNDGKGGNTTQVNNTGPKDTAIGFCVNGNCTTNNTNTTPSPQPSWGSVQIINQNDIQTGPATQDLGNAASDQQVGANNYFFIADKGHGSVPSETALADTMVSSDSFKAAAATRDSSVSATGAKIWTINENKLIELKVQQ